MNIMESTRQYEAWLAKQTVVIAKDLRKKKELMVKDAFRFFRGKLLPLGAVMAADGCGTKRRARD